MSKLKISYTGGIGFEVKSRKHTLKIDLSEEKGGKDEGMNPPEIFMASLGSCIGVYVVRYCQTAKIDTSDMHMHLAWKFSDDKTRISNINIKLCMPNAELGKRAEAILNVARRCLIHNTITGNPEINVSLECEDGEVIN